MAGGPERSDHAAMCGIAGVIDTGGRSLPAAALEQASRQLAHRGPDAVGTLTSQVEVAGCLWTVGLAHRRLSVLDTSAAGNQPAGLYAPAGSTPSLCRADTLGSADLLTVYNGEIYNFAELRRDLTRSTGQIPRSACDTETLLGLWARDGSTCLDRLEGMFAFCMVDRRASRRGAGVTLVRDRFGKKPLLWAWHDGRLLFASEMRAMHALAAACQLPLTPHPGALAGLLKLGVTVAPRTIFEPVYMLPPGALLELHSSGPRVERWHQPSRSSAPGSISESPLTHEELQGLVAEAVGARLVADVPLGVFLSGGVDSSIIAHHAREQLRRPRAFSVAFPGVGRFDESQVARQVARHLGLEHHVFEMTPADVQSAADFMFAHLAEPFADSSWLPTYLLSRETRRQVTVALSGDGADELFGGYHRYRAYSASGLTIAAARWLALLPAGKSSAWADRARQARRLRRGVHERDVMKRHEAWISATWPDDLLSAEARDAVAAAGPLFAEDALRPQLAVQPKADPLAVALELDFAVGLPSDMLRKVDLASMAVGLEVRCPFLDSRLVARVRSRPVAERMPNGRLKGLLIDSYKDVLPRAVWDRRKQGFEVPVTEWIKGPLRDWYFGHVTADAVSRLGWCRLAAIERLMAEHASGRDDHGQLLWTLLVLHAWAGRWR